MQSYIAFGLNKSSVFKLASKNLVTLSQEILLGAYIYDLNCLIFSNGLPLKCTCYQPCDIKTTVVFCFSSYAIHAIIQRVCLQKCQHGISKVICLYTDASVNALLIENESIFTKACQHSVTYMHFYYRCISCQTISCFIFHVRVCNAIWNFTPLFS